MTEPALFARHTFGDVTITTLRDGEINIPVEALSNTTEAEVTGFLTTAGQAFPSASSINAFVVQQNGRTVLIDTGTLPGAIPNTGNLPASLSAAGIAPAQVDQVLMTHLHVDHFGHLASPDGTAMFPAAELGMHEAEAGWWLNPANAAKVAPERQALFGMIATAVAPYKDNIRTFAAGEVAPGIVAVPLPGHTPGHTGYLIGTGPDRVLIWGDIVHMPDVQSRKPDIGIMFDSDPAQAIETRHRALAMAADENLIVGGMHMHFPGLARVERRDGAYALVPITSTPPM